MVCRLNFEGCAIKLLLESIVGGRKQHLILDFRIVGRPDEVASAEIKLEIGGPRGVPPLPTWRRQTKQDAPRHEEKFVPLPVLFEFEIVDCPAALILW